MVRWMVWILLVFFFDSPRWLKRMGNRNQPLEGCWVSSWSLHLATLASSPLERILLMSRAPRRAPQADGGRAAAPHRVRGPGIQPGPPEHRGETRGAFLFSFLFSPTSYRVKVCIIIPGDSFSGLFLGVSVFWQFWACWAF